MQIMLSRQRSSVCPCPKMLILLMPPAYTFIKTSFGCILGTDFVARVRTSGPPGFDATIALMVLAIFLDMLFNLPDVGVQHVDWAPTGP